MSDLPAFEGKNATDDSNSTVHFRRNKDSVNDYCGTPTFQTSAFDQGYLQQKHYSYLEPIIQPRTVAGDALNEMISSVQQNNGDSSSEGIIKNQTPLRPPPLTITDDLRDSYL